MSLFERFRDRSQALGQGVQQVVVTVLLVLVYLVGLGVTRVLATVFYRKGLQRFVAGDQPSYWVDAEGYESDPTRLLKQF